MPTAIAITAGAVSVAAELFDTPCARAIAAALPLRGQANTWGEEIYFDIGVRAEPDDTARKTVAPGDIGYWPPGDALCFFFGKTPISGPDEIRPASPVNLVGRIQGDAAALKGVSDGAGILVRRAGES